MPKSRGLSLAQRLYLSSSLLVAMLLGLALLVWVLLNHQAAEAQAVQDKRVPQLARISALELNVTRASLQLRHAMLARDPQQQAQALADIGARQALIERTLAEFGAAMDDTAGRDAFAPLPGLVATFWRTAGDNVKLVQEGRLDEAFDFLVSTTIPARNALLQPLDAERARQDRLLAGEVGLIRDEAQWARNLVLAVVLLVSAALAAYALYIVRVMRQLGAEPDELRQVAVAVAGGDLTPRFALRPGDQGSVMAALQRMAGQLAQTVQAVRSNAESVATASAQIASGNADLANRTEHQAANLQQAASAMEQLGSTVQHNADNSRQAHQLAAGASAVAGQGGEMVQQVVATMAQIDDSSRRIAEIIGVIDSIAFQTNILALNAAVEAARAGEQGRGFAVVAAEVRSLAQRSAEAAREIKALISTSVERVAQGRELVDRTGATVLEIVAGIRRVSDIVGEISHASVEQSAGVGQVGQAVSQMDQATQQNAALVEQSAAAADSLRQQAQQLVQAVAVFKLA
jgi:methyl-accepting chemotaxis protein